MYSRKPWNPFWQVWELLAAWTNCWWLKNARKGTKWAFQLTNKQLESLGFVMNMEKSLCKATQRTKYLMFIIHSETMTFVLPKVKIKEIKQKYRKLLQIQQVTVCHIAHMVGVLAATRIAITPAPLHYCALQWLKNRKGCPFTTHMSGRWPWIKGVDKIWFGGLLILGPTMEDQFTNQLTKWMGISIAFEWMASAKLWN